MIFNIIFDIISGIFTTILTALPNVPDLPSSITDVSDTVATFLAQPLDVVEYIYGQTFFLAIVAIGVVIFAFEWVYHGAMWVIHKIPIVNIH